MDGIRAWIEVEGSGNWFSLAFPVCLLALLILFKGQRVRFLIPSLSMSIVIINPEFYRLWDSLGLYAYWRILWIVPVIPVVATVVPMITEKIQKPWLKGIAAVAGAGVVLLGGTFLYRGPGGSFVKAANAAKLPNNVVQMADRMLELNDQPRVIAQDPIGVYIRQYTEKIDTLFGRDIEGAHIWRTSNNAIQANKELNNSTFELTTIKRLMLVDEYDYLICNANPRQRFRLVDTVGDYGIYETIDAPSVIKERNELGQVISVTTLDKWECQINNAGGYSTASYTYDKNGHVTYEYYTNDEGNRIKDAYGVAGYEWEYDNQGHILMERTLGVDGEMVQAFRNYAEVRREYKGDRKITEAYFDEEGNARTQIAGYTAYKNIWYQDRIISRTYLGKDGYPVNRSDGYSKAVWSQNENGTWSVHFEDLNENTVDYRGINLIGNIRTGVDGWSEWMIPDYDTTNSCFIIGYVNLGEKQEGDKFTCQIEIEFKDVTATGDAQFIFQTQGDVDHKWSIRNIWYPNVVHLVEPPDDGRYLYKSTISIDKSMAQASDFQIGFRCDNWASGAFRVRNVKIEKGDRATEWTPGITEGSERIWSNKE